MKILAFVILSMVFVYLLDTAFAQSGVGQLPAFNIVGNPTASTAPPTAFPIFSTTNIFTVPQSITPTPTWTAATAIDGTSVNVNAFPKAAYFGANIVGVYSGFTGAVNVPGTSTQLQANGTSGYCRTAAAASLCVGQFGVGLINVAGGQAWGGAFLATNSPTTQPVNGSGFNFATINGAECDVNIMKVSAAAPTGSAACLLISSASESQPTGNYQGILLQTATVPFKSGIAFQDASASNFAIEIGSSSSGNGAPSMSIVFETRTAGAAPISGTLLLDALANLTTNVSFISTGAAIQNSPASGPSLINLAPSTASQQAVNKYFDAGTLKWTVGKDTDNSFFILDSTSSLKPLLVSAAGAVSVGETGKNLNLIGTPIQVNGVSGVSTVCTVTVGNTLTFTNGVLTTKGANCT
jgi:hypothetical protein